MVNKKQINISKVKLQSQKVTARQITTTQSNSVSTLKYASARIRLKQEPDKSHNSTGTLTPPNKQAVEAYSKVSAFDAQKDFRLVEFLINEFYRKKDRSYKSVSRQ